MLVTFQSRIQFARKVQKYGDAFSKSSSIYMIINFPPMCHNMFRYLIVIRYHWTIHVSGTWVVLTAVLQHVSQWANGQFIVIYQNLMSWLVVKHLIFAA